MQAPKRTKYRKYQKGDISGIQPNTLELMFGRYGLRSLEAGRLSARNIETVRRVFVRTFKRTGQVWARIFPDIPITAKPLQARMGKGKGVTSFWASKIVAGQILFEMDGISISLAKAAAKIAYKKLPIKISFVAKGEISV